VRPSQLAGARAGLAQDLESAEQGGLELLGGYIGGGVLSMLGILELFNHARNYYKLRIIIIDSFKTSFKVEQYLYNK
jgi:hypothetical protein